MRKNRCAELARLRGRGNTNGNSNISTSLKDTVSKAIQGIPNKDILSNTRRWAINKRLSVVGAALAEAAWR